jgi:hypothetical protein
VRLTLASALAVTAVGVLALTLPADAAPQKATTSCGTCVAPITCAQEDSCVLDYTGGYWRARQANGTVWVRLTLLNGN